MTLNRFITATALFACVNLLYIVDACSASSDNSCASIFTTQVPSWTRDPQLFKKVQATWADCCTQVKSQRPTTYRFLVHAIDIDLFSAKSVAEKIATPSRNSKSLSYISEAKSSIFLGLRVGLIYDIPPQNILTTSPVDFASNRRPELGPVYSRTMGIMTPYKLLEETWANNWNEVLAAGIVDDGGTHSKITVQGIFLKSSALPEEAQFAQDLAGLTGLPIVHIR